MSTAGALVNIYKKWTRQVLSVIITCTAVLFANGIIYFELDKRKKNDGRFQKSILLHLLDKTLHLRASYDFARLADLAKVVQKIDKPTHSISLYPVDSVNDYLILVYWIVIYSLDSDAYPAFVQPAPVLYFFLFIACIMPAWHRLSVRLFQAAITEIFSHQPKNVIRRARRVELQSVVLLLLPVYSKNKLIKQTF